MALLKRIKASTLMETMVATVLLVVFFTVSSLLLNSWLDTSVKYHMSNVSAELQELQYQQAHGKISVPYYEERGAWIYEVFLEEGDKTIELVFTARHSSNKNNHEVRRIVSK